MFSHMVLFIFYCLCVFNLFNTVQRSMDSQSVHSFIYLLFFLVLGIKHKGFYTLFNRALKKIKRVRKIFEHFFILEKTSTGLSPFFHCFVFHTACKHILRQIKEMEVREYTSSIESKYCRHHRWEATRTKICKKIEYT